MLLREVDERIDQGRKVLLSPRLDRGGRWLAGPATPLDLEDLVQVHKPLPPYRELREGGFEELPPSVRPWRDGTKAFRFDPLVFIERLVAITPHPREHQLTYHGVFAPAASLRHLVVPRPSAIDPEDAHCHESPTATEPPEPTTKHHTGSSSYRWPELIKRVFAEDVLRCPNCHGHRTLLTAITDPFVIRRILAHFGLPTEVIPLEPPRPPPEP
ncbi:MAG: hypothetical protein KC593_22880, partial [Myxococcales bacterium]|nr:hypothetical protein [Myxococcales bacterium]